MTFTAGQAAVPAPGPARSPASAGGSPARVTQAGGTQVRGTPADSPAPPAAASPAIQVNCTLAAGQHAAFADVVVAGGKTARAPS
jgi:hypothetical protein